MKGLLQLKSFTTDNSQVFTQSMCTEKSHQILFLLENLTCTAVLKAIVSFNNLLYFSVGFLSLINYLVIRG
jgi:hypothetical protein